MAKKHVEIIVRDYLKTLKDRNIHAEKAILFGSYARGLRIPMKTSTCSDFSRTLIPIFPGQLFQFNSDIYSDLNRTLPERSDAG